PGSLLEGLCDRTWGEGTLPTIPLKSPEAPKEDWTAASILCLKWGTKAWVVVYRGSVTLLA
ncbi:hypothetical protein OAH05_02905, partial [bacterium]|nr:hypothetical protein [bacterium]